MRNRGIGRGRMFLGELMLVVAVVLWATALLMSPHAPETADGTEILLKLTQGELAQWTAMSREGLNKLINRWIGDGILSQRSGFLVVHDVEQIDEIAEFGE